MYPQLDDYIAQFIGDLDKIPAERKKELGTITRFIRDKVQSVEPANLIFICTHNSRRSHLCQIWTATAAQYYGIKGIIHTYSGGTEATAFNPRAAAAVQRAGFRVMNPGGDNPHYEVRYSDEGPAMVCYSKVYDDPNNPGGNFAAIMTCTDADANCPIVAGASIRVPIPYDDPKESDGTEQESLTYDERCRQIAVEMFYMMTQVPVN